MWLKSPGVNSKKSGEFYTPHEVSRVMAEIISHHVETIGKNKISVYDPCSGSASLLITIGEAAERHGVQPNGVTYYAQELKEATFDLTRMNLLMRDILPNDIVIRRGDTLAEDWPMEDDFDARAEHNALRVDATVANPPYSQSYSPKDLEHDPRFAYGLPQKSKADYAFLEHCLYHLKPDGIMCIVLPHGVLFRGDPNSDSGEGVIRRELLKRHNIEAVIGLPANIFYGTGIATIIMVLRRQRTDSDVLFVDASKGFVKDGKKNKLRACDMKRIVDTVVERCEVENYSRVVSYDEIKANGYNLNIPRYVDSSEPPEKWDIYAFVFGGIPATEVDEIRELKVLPGLRDDLFRGDDYLSLTSDDVKGTVYGNASVQAFQKDYERSFSGFDMWLHQQLIDKVSQVDVKTMEQTITGEVNGRLADVSLLDPYDAYQVIDETWATIANDIEVIHRDGFNAVRCVDPHMVLSKKKEDDGTPVEV